MSCLTTASLLACLLDPSTLEVSAYASSQISGDFSFYEEGRQIGNPLWGRVALQLKPQLSRSVAVIYGWEHVSVINSSERGEERLFAGFIWTPFRRN